MLFLGSPPRMRGKLARKIEGYARSRITPAHAGKTKNKQRLKVINQDHPRACGENLLQFTIRRPNIGSPPRMRGKHDEGQAGNNGAEDHPRACGENVE